MRKVFIGGPSLAHSTLIEYLMISEHRAGEWRQKEY